MRVEETKECGNLRHMETLLCVDLPPTGGAPGIEEAARGPSVRPIGLTPVNCLKWGNWTVVFN